MSEDNLKHIDKTKNIGTHMLNHTITCLTLKIKLIKKTTRLNQIVLKPNQSQLIRPNQQMTWKILINSLNIGTLIQNHTIEKLLL